MTVILIALAAFASTLLGGSIALRLKDKLHLILGFSAGAVIAVAFFDLLPESLELGTAFYEPATLLALAALGFFAYMTLDRTVFLHAHAHDEHEGEAHAHESRRGSVGAAVLCLHSFLDGLAIGLAFQVSAAVGAIVAVAVLVHDFSDGINTVNFILRHDGKGKRAYGWLLADAAAPVVGVISTMFFSLGEQSLSIILALFAGFFLYIGASDLIPESHHAHPKFLTTLMTLVGALVLFGAIRLAGV